mmetsp:Transcript_85443/g.241888  ORF Transcript_85443/g.241888 Transcript_85443/m.241888 type:complete len:246 (-) Transcript_85443:480-1217(-)
MSLTTSLAFSTFSPLPAIVTMVLFGPDPGGPEVLGIVISTFNASLTARMMQPSLPMRSGRALEGTLMASLLKFSYDREVKPLAISSSKACLAWATASGLPSMRKMLASMLIVFTSVFSLIMLMVAPLGPITMPTLSSGTFNSATESCSLGFSSAAAAPFAAMIFAIWSGVAIKDWSTVGPALYPAMPGTRFVAALAPGTALPPAVFSTWASRIFLSSSFFCCFALFAFMPVDTSQSPPLPSSTKV